MSKQPSLLGFGTAMMDILAFVDEDFMKTVQGAKGGTVRVPYSVIQDILKRLPGKPSRIPGGAAANTVIGFCKLNGGPAALLSEVGDDDDGKLYAADLQHDGVNTDRLKVAPSLPTGQVLALVTPDSERTMRSFYGANSALTPDSLFLSDFTGYTHLFLEGYTFNDRALGVRVLELAKQAGLTICIDLNSPEIISHNLDILPELLKKYVTAVFANELEAATFWNTDSEQEALERFSELCPVAIVKQGRRGTLIKEAGYGAVHVDAVPVNAVDTTGAGDLWAAGFMAGWLRGKSLEDAGRLGAEVSARIVQVPGARLAEKDWDYLKNLL